MRAEGSSPDELLGQFVHFEFKDFIESDYLGNEQNEALPRDGYLVYNDHRKDFGYGAFRTSDSYTIEADVLDYIKQRHPEFMKDIVQSKGFFIGGIWNVVDDSGKLVQ